MSSLQRLAMSVASDLTHLLTVQRASTSSITCFIKMITKLIANFAYAFTICHN